MSADWGLIRDPLELVRALIGCGVSADLAAQTAIAYAPRAGGDSVVSGESSARSGMSKRQYERNIGWNERMRVMPYESGQCYLHPVRYGRRKFFLTKLGKDPTFRSFVETLEPGDLQVQVAKEMSLFLISDATLAPPRLVYHVAVECSQGERVCSFYDAVANFIRLYPWVETRYECDVDVLVDIPLVGTVGAQLPAPVTSRADILGAQFVLPQFEEWSDSTVVNTDDGLFQVDHPELTARFLSTVTSEHLAIGPYSCDVTVEAEGDAVFATPTAGCSLGGRRHVFVLTRGSSMSLCRYRHLRVRVFRMPSGHWYSHMRGYTALGDYLHVGPPDGGTVATPIGDGALPLVVGTHQFEAGECRATRVARCGSTPRVTVVSGFVRIGAMCLSSGQSVVVGSEEVTLSLHIGATSVVRFERLIF